MDNGRAGKHTENYNIFVKAFNKNPECALRWLLYLRDIEFGLGERDAYKGLLIELSHKNTELAIRLFRLDLAQFGRFDDELSIYDKLNSACQGVIIEKIKIQLEEDLTLLKEGKGVSLLAKWMPSINTSSKHTRHLAYMLMKDLLMTPRQYRKTLSRLRKSLQLVETKISQKDYQSIDYKYVPSTASSFYKKAFQRNDTERVNSYINLKKTGIDYVKILNQYKNSCLPHTFMDRIMDSRYDIITTLFEEAC